jgi:hypothetical protein
VHSVKSLCARRLAQLKRKILIKGSVLSDSKFAHIREINSSYRITVSMVLFTIELIYNPLHLCDDKQVALFSIKFLQHRDLGI